MPEHCIARTASAHDYPLIIRELLDGAVERTPLQEIVSGERRMTYRDLRERVGRLASGLAGLGVEPGQTVAVMDWDTHRYLECFYAVPMMGAVLHMVNVRLSPEQILYTLNHARDEVLLINADFLPILAAIRDQLQTVRRIVLLADGEAPADARADAEYEHLLATAEPDYAFPELAEDTRATTFYTTGTTGEPKGVYFSHRQLMLHTFAVRSAVAGTAHGSLAEDDVYMPITPMFHVHAWGLPYVATLVGVKQVYPGRYLPDRLLRLIDREAVTFSHCVPTILGMLLSHPDAEATDLSRWKCVIGGAALPQALAARALEHGIDAYTGYGLSETCPVLTLALLTREMTRWDRQRQVAQRCKTGRPIPLVRIRVVDEAMNDLPHDGRSQGEVVVRAPWLTQGYLYDPERSEALWYGGWLHTGDIGVIDPDGFLRVTDRMKDVIKSGGEWISSIELEGLLLQHPAVAEAAVVGVVDERWGERPLALVVAREGERLDEAAVREHVRGFVAEGRLPEYAVPEQVRLVEKIPKTSVGKIDKKVIRAEYG